jgi:hypothetical protein
MTMDDPQQLPTALCGFSGGKIMRLLNRFACCWVVDLGVKTQGAGKKGTGGLVRCSDPLDAWVWSYVAAG